MPMYIKYSGMMGEINSCLAPMEVSFFHQIREYPSGTATKASGSNNFIHAPSILPLLIIF